MMKNKKAFSLIELIVVIAIIGLLAAIAVPAYSSYSKRSIVSQGINLAGEMAQRAMAYQASHGNLATAQENLNYPAAPTNPPANLGEYAIAPHVAILNYAPSTTVSACDNFSVTTYISNYGTGVFTSATDAPFIYYSRNYFNVNGVWQSTCIFIDLDVQGNAVSDSPMVPNCYNEANPADVSAWQDLNDTLANSC